MPGSFFSPDPTEALAAAGGALQFLEDARWSLLAAHTEAWHGVAAESAEERRLEFSARLDLATEAVVDLRRLMVARVELVEQLRLARLVGAS